MHNLHVIVPDLDVLPLGYFKANLLFLSSRLFLNDDNYHYLKTKGKQDDPFCTLQELKIFKLTFFQTKS